MPLYFPVPGVALMILCCFTVLSAGLTPPDHNTYLLSCLSAAWLLIMTCCDGFQQRGVRDWPAVISFSRVVYYTDLLSWVSAVWFMILTCCPGFQQSGLWYWPAVMGFNRVVYDTDLLSWVSTEWFMILTCCHGFQQSGLWYWPAVMCFSSVVYDTDLLSWVSTEWFMILTCCHVFQQCGLWYWPAVVCFSSVVYRWALGRVTAVASSTMMRPLRSSTWMSYTRVSTSATASSATRHSPTEPTMSTSAATLTSPYSASCVLKHFPLKRKCYSIDRNVIKMLLTHPVPGVENGSKSWVISKNMWTQYTLGTSYSDAHVGHSSFGKCPSDVMLLLVV